MAGKASLILTLQIAVMARGKRPKLFQRSEDSRSETRTPVTVPATCRVGERPAEEVLVTDLSSEGCRVRLVSIGVTKSEPVSLSLGGEQPVSGRLKWIKQGALGVVFDTPLDDAVVDRLAALPPPDNVVPLRRSARS